MVLLILRYGLVEKFLGDSVLKKPKIKYLLCTKILLFRHSEKVGTVNKFTIFYNNVKVEHVKYLQN